MKFEEIKNVGIVFLHHSINRYKVQQDELFIGKDTYLAPYIKGQVTMLVKEINKLEGKLSRDCYTHNRAEKMSNKIKDYYLKKAIKIEDDNPDEYVPPELLIEKLGIDGYELMKSYFAVKAGIMCLQQEILKDKREDCECLMLRFKALQKFWELQILG